MNVIATREALERFAHELPAGVAGDRLRRLAETARALYDQAVADKSKASLAGGWADHDLAVLVTESLGQTPHGGDAGLRAAAETLFLGVRRRLIDALQHDPDDLALALALALGAATATDDARLVDDLALVTTSLARPQAGPRLVQAAVRLVLLASSRSDRAIEKAAIELAPAARDAVERLGKRLPEHPDLALDRIRLNVLAARATDGHERSAHLSMARGMLADHEARFGPSEAQREIVGQVLQLRGKDAAPSDVAKDALALIAADAKEHALDPRRTGKLVRAVARAGALDKDTAKKVKELLVDLPAGRSNAWDETWALLHEALGDEAALLAISEKALQRDPKDQHAARALFDRLLRNVRQRLPAPFEATILDLVAQAAPFQSLGRLSADDVDALFHLLDETFGADRVVAFAKRLVQAKELEGKDFVWKKALAAAERAKDQDAIIDLSRRALQRKSAPAETRLALVRALVERGQDLDEADDALKPLLNERGPHNAEAQALRQRLRSDPRYRESRLQALLAFEHQLGIGTEKAHELRVAYTSPSYSLAEVAERAAPEFYDHRHLRVMLRAEDLPKGVAPGDLKKGDKLTAPIRGQDATFEKDKDNYRIYWIADARAVRFAMGADDLGKRLANEEAGFGIGTGKVLPLKVSWDGKKSRLSVRLLDKGGNEFRTRPALDADQLPDGMSPQSLGGRGKRLWGAIDKAGENYVVSGKVLAQNPDAPAGEVAPEELEAETPDTAPAPTPEATEGAA